MAILKKLKRGLKKAAKVAIPVGAALLAAKALKREKCKCRNGIYQNLILVRTTLNKMTSKAVDDTMPSNLSNSDMGKTNRLGTSFSKRSNRNW